MTGPVAPATAVPGRGERSRTSRPAQARNKATQAARHGGFCRGKRALGPQQQSTGMTSTARAQRDTQPKVEQGEGQGLIFSPRHRASSDFWIFPSLFTSQ